MYLNSTCINNSPGGGGALVPVSQRKFKLSFFEVKLTSKYAARFSAIPDVSCFDEVRLELREGEETEWRVAEGEGYSLGISLSLIYYFTAVSVG